MAVTFRSYGSSPGADSTSCVITKPVGLAVGDLMVAEVVGTKNVAIAGNFTAPENWTSIREDTGGDGTNYLKTALFWKIAVQADVDASDFTFTATNAGSNRGTITAWYGHDSTTPINANNGQYNAASPTITSPTITPSVANCMILLFCGLLGADNTIFSYAIVTDNPASWDEAYELYSDLAKDINLSLGYAFRPETSATGNGTAVADPGARNTGQLVAIAPLTGWQGKISGVTNPAKVMGVAVANIASVKGVASA